MLSSKAPDNRTTAPNTELFTIRLEVFKTTSINIKCIIFINNSLKLARRVVDPLVYSGQVHLLAVYSALTLFFSSSLSYKIKLWNYPSKAK